MEEGALLGHRVPETLEPTRMPVHFTKSGRGPGNTGRDPGEAQPAPTLVTASSEHIATLPGDPDLSLGVPKDTVGVFSSLLGSQAQGILKTEDTCAGLITGASGFPPSLVLMTPKAGDSALLRDSPRASLAPGMRFQAQQEQAPCPEGWIYPHAAWAARGLPRGSPGRRPQRPQSELTGPRFPARQPCAGELGAEPRGVLDAWLWWGVCC